jgi:pyruvate/2-oxoglutarate dehydrogenase complex dihydrolipoamide acyltransferase (E2) component
MAAPQTVPCVNSNDEVVQVVAVNVKPGEFVKAGAVVGAVETDKSLLDVVAEQDGYVLSIECQPQQKVRVGSVMLWLGSAPDEAVPDAIAVAPRAAGGVGQPTAKARVMLEALGLDPERVPRAGLRLTVADIEAWLAGPGKGRAMTEAPRPDAT